MAQVSPRDLAAPLFGSLVAVPSTDLGACETCHSGTKPGYAHCYPCHAGEQLLWQRGVPTVLPISLSLEGSQLHFALRRYKGRRPTSNAEATAVGDPRVTGVFALQLAGLIETFMRSHAACVGEYDLVTCIPSEHRVAFEAVARRLQRFQPGLEQVLAWAGGSTRDLSASRFTVTRPLTALRVLVLDDTFTTGASVFSATAALRAAGAMVSTILVVGRHASPGAWPPTAELLERMKRRPLAWDESECVVCRPSTSLFSGFSGT